MDNSRARSPASHTIGFMIAADVLRPKPRAFWSDARFLVGIVLIVASIVGVWLVVAAARQTVPVLAANRTIVPGEALSSSDLRVVDVALGQLGESYATPATMEPGAVATRTIAQGELVPLSAIADASHTTTTAVVLSSAVEVPAAVTVGSTVDVWVADQVERGVYATPHILVAGATVAGIDRKGSAFGSTGTSVELVIARADVAATLAAVAGGSSLSVVPAAGASR